MSRSYSLSTWLEEFSEATGRLRDLACDDLLVETGAVDKWATRDDDSSAPWRFERHGPSEVWRILNALSHSSLAEEGGVLWLHSFDYKDSDAWEKLSPMVGVHDDELILQQRRLGELARSHGRDVEVDDVVDLCNLNARNGTQLFSVNMWGDAYLYVALTPAGCRAAIERGLFEVGPVYQRTPLVGMSMGTQAQTESKARSKPSLTVLWVAAALVAFFSVVYVVIALARGGSHFGALAIVIALIVGFELAKSAAIRKLDFAFGGRHPTLMRVLKLLTRT